ncbi:AtpZ/AtpI family protein [Mucilaginibacter ginkgonis]|uniref:AtpZ/AtpI family protein n=1 Tax=Mucilaginibacter ginkgonis TaxID=2682091 RepID=A0A6I4HUS0_9SPHI|nr:AtpZ/AtpI family protein [Mucilaginibacter ginkgonis]QQL50078.1 AtpZ/AtpI family protein [Mucilaginibacter ginkgonis]
MADAQQNNDDNNGKQANNYIKFTGLAFQMIAIIGIMTFIGYRIDVSSGHQTKWVTAAFALFGVFSSLVLVFRGIKE